MAITTLYNGIEYRSRLEARWASFFSRIGWHTTYEPFDGDGYIPDFLVHGTFPLLVEVKPAVTPGDYEAPIEKITKGLQNHWERDILIVGASPLPNLVSEAWGGPSAGLIGEPGFGSDDCHEWWFQTALWASCDHCHKPTVWPDMGNYTSRPCHGTRGDKFPLSPSRLILDAWNDACNDVKWKGRAA